MVAILTTKVIGFMSRKTVFDSAFDKELTRLRLEGIDLDNAFDIAWKEASKVEENSEERSKEQRRKNNARYQAEHRRKAQCYSEKPRKAVTIYLPDETLETLDKRAKHYREISGGGFPLAWWRSVVIIECLS